MSLNEIEKEWDVSKVLITENSNPQYLAFYLGQYDIYLHNLRPVITSLEKSLASIPVVADLRSQSQEDVQLFVTAEKQFKGYKIFKHGNAFFEYEDCVGLVANTVKNMLHLFQEPVTFYIDCKDKILQKMFYDKAVLINKEDCTGHSFDFEEYDYRLIVKRYETYIEDDGPVFTGTSVFTTLTGKDMPNYWNQA